MTETLSSLGQPFVLYAPFLYELSEDYADAIDAAVTALRYRLYGTEEMERMP